MSLFEEVESVYFNLKAQKYDLSYTAPECQPKLNSDQVKATIQVLERKLEEQCQTNIHLLRLIIDLQDRCSTHNI